MSQDARFVSDVALPRRFAVGLLLAWASAVAAAIRVRAPVAAGDWTPSGAAALDDLACC